MQNGSRESQGSGFLSLGRSMALDRSVHYPQQLSSAKSGSLYQAHDLGSSLGRCRKYRTYNVSLVLYCMTIP